MAKGLPDDKYIETLEAEVSAYLERIRELEEQLRLYEAAQKAEPGIHYCGHCGKPCRCEDDPWVRQANDCACNKEDDRLEQENAKLRAELNSAKTEQCRLIFDIDRIDDELGFDDGGADSQEDRLQKIRNLRAARGPTRKQRASKPENRGRGGGK